jgi:hypothetical protein
MTMDHVALHAILSSDPKTYDIGMLQPLKKQLTEAKAKAFTEGDPAAPDIELMSQVVDAIAAEQVARLDAYAQRAMAEFEKQVRAKRDKEMRMIDSVRAFNGSGRVRDSKAYPSDAGDRWMGDNDRPRIKALRTKTLKYAARLSDMTLPSDDLPIKVDPQPKPDPNSFPTLAAEMVQGAQMDATTVDNAARAAADGMQSTIEGQLREQGFVKIGRKVIRDACKLGVGICRGPTVEYRQRRKPVGTESEIILDESPIPGLDYVDPWMFYDDMSQSLDDCSLAHVVHLMDRKKLTKLRRYPRIIQENIDLLLEEKDPELPSELSTSIALRNAKTDTAEPLKDHWAVIEAHGIMDPDDLENCCGIPWDDKSTLPLIEFWFCNGRAIKWKLSAMEMDWRVPFYNCTLFPCDDTIWGESIPNLGVSGAKIIDGALDATLSNASIASGPFIAFRKGAVKPMDDTWTVRGPKTLSVETDGNVSEAIHTFTVDANVEGNLNLVQFGQDILDQDILFDQIADGDLAGDDMPASGLLQQINLRTVFQRMLAAEMDDTWFKPLGERWVQWNIQFSKDDAIKGDFDVKGVASTTLVSKDLALQHTQVYMQMSAQPQFAGMTDNYELLASYNRMLDIPNRDKILFSKEVAQQNAQQQAQNGGDPMIGVKMEELKLKQAELQLKAQEVQLAHAERMAEIQRQLQKDQQDAASKHEDNYTKVLVAQSQKEVALIGFAQTSKQNIRQVAAIIQKAAMDADTKKFIKTLEVGTDLHAQQQSDRVALAGLAHDERKADKANATTLISAGLQTHADAAHKVADQRHERGMQADQHAHEQDMAEEAAETGPDNEQGEVE